MRASFHKTGETLLAWQANQEPAGMDLRCKEATDSIELLGLKLVVGGFHGLVSEQVMEQVVHGWNCACLVTVARTLHF